MKFTATIFVTVASLVILGVLPAAATDVVIPNTNQNNPGPSNQAFPFNQGTMRVQQVFAADQFGGLTGVVEQIAFRVDESSGGPFGPSAPIDTEVRLSHTTIAPGNLSTTFANNIGPDETLVLDANISLSSSGVGFDIIVDIDDVFVYNGNDNLLVEYKVFNSARTTQFDAAGLGLGQGGTPWTDRVWSIDGPNAPIGSLNGDDGYVTQFSIAGATAVEPSSWGAIKSIYNQ